MKQTRILITGCAGSGNTLLRRLFHSFADVDVLMGDRKVRPKDGKVIYKGDEVTLEDLINRPSDAPFVVGKRVKQTIFSTDMITEEDLKKQADLIRKHGIKIINTIRDGRDVILSTVTSKKLPINPRRWIHCMRHRKIFDVITLEVRYEDLVTDPDKIQDVIAYMFGMEPLHKFSDYPEFLPDREYDTRQFRAKPTKGGDKRERYRPKKISAGRIGKDLTAYRGLMKDKTQKRHFEEELRKAGYI